MLLGIRTLIARFLSRPHNPVTSDLNMRLETIEASQAEIMRMLQEFMQNEVPRNVNGIHQIGPARTVFFFNDLLPEVYLTLVSVLQGVTLAILIDEFSFDYWLNSPTTFAYLLASFLIIVAFWYSYLSAMFDGRWPFHLFDTILFFAAATAQAIAVKNVTRPHYWCIATAVMGFFVAIIYARQITLVRELAIQNTFQIPEEADTRILGLKFLTIAFILITVVSFLFAIITARNPDNMLAAFLANLIPAMYIWFAFRNAKEANLDAIA
ncbi:MAG: hypothetical protein KJ063_23900 [Anaerolineae bacterium]|nr:hypothetical protein [Anaerolineae bacterium]